MTFTIEQFRKYLLKSDSLGDALYFLSDISIIEANRSEKAEDEMEEMENDKDDYPEGYFTNF